MAPSKAMEDKSTCSSLDAKCPSGWRSSSLRICRRRFPGCSFGASVRTNCWGCSDRSWPCRARDFLLGRSRWRWRETRSSSSWAIRGARLDRWRVPICFRAFRRRYLRLRRVSYGIWRNVLFVDAVAFLTMLVSLRISHPIVSIVTLRPISHHDVVFCCMEPLGQNGTRKSVSH